LNLRFHCTGRGSKPPKGAVVKSHGAERLGKGWQQECRLVWIKELNASEPLKRIREGMTLWNETKSVPVSKEQVWHAYKKVRSNAGSAGIDGISMEEYDAKRSEHLYKQWNRMASGSYFPPPVKEVEIPRKDGKMRNLGIPTISDRVAQMDVKDYLEPRFEKIFSPHSYGYRPGKNARAYEIRRTETEAGQRHATGRRDKPATGKFVS